MTEQLKTYDIQNEKWEEAPVNSVFEQEPSEAILHSSVIRQLANARIGTASTLTRSEVSGGGRKPWRQKGTGRARAGSIRSPLWRGGGIAFGPKPRSYKTDMPQKMRQIALRSAVTSTLEGSIMIKGLDKFSNKTKDFVKLLETMNLIRGKVLLVTDQETDYSNIYLATGNLHYVKIISASNIGAYDLLKADHVIYTDKSLPLIERRAVVC